MAARFRKELGSGCPAVYAFKSEIAEGFDRKSGGMHYLDAARMAYCAHKASYRKAVTSRIKALFAGAA